MVLLARFGIWHPRLGLGQLKCFVTVSDLFSNKNYRKSPSETSINRLGTVTGQQYISVNLAQAQQIKLSILSSGRAAGEYQKILSPLNYDPVHPNKWIKF